MGSGKDADRNMPGKPGFAICATDSEPNPLGDVPPAPRRIATVALHERKSIGSRSGRTRFRSGGATLIPSRSSAWPSGCSAISHGKRRPPSDPSRRSSEAPAAPSIL